MENIQCSKIFNCFEGKTNLITQLFSVYGKLSVNFEKTRSI